MRALLWRWCLWAAGWHALHRGAGRGPTVIRVSGNQLQGIPNGRSLSVLGSSLVERAELSQRGAAVDPYVFPADQALPELEDMENTDADPAAVARYAQEVTNYLGSPDFVVNDKVFAIKPMEHIRPLALDVGKQIAVPFADCTRPMQDAGRLADHVMDYVVSEGA